VALHFTWLLKKSQNSTFFLVKLAYLRRRLSLYSTFQSALFSIGLVTMEPCSILMTAIVILMEPLLPWGRFKTFVPGAEEMFVAHCEESRYLRLSTRICRCCWRKQRSLDNSSGSLSLGGWKVWDVVGVEKERGEGCWEICPLNIQHRLH
jgi:hypothetical protein